MYLAVEVKGPAEGRCASQQNCHLSGLHRLDGSLSVARVWRLVTRPQRVALIHNHHLEGTGFFLVQRRPLEVQAHL